MITRRFIIISGAAAALAAGAGGAIAATAQDDAKKAEQSVLSDAAKRLDVSPEKLRSALSAAEDAQLDQAVKDGKLTQAQANAIKQARRERGTVLDFGHGGRGGPGHHGHGPGFGRGPGGDVAFPAAAKALGLTEAQLRQKLQSGKSIADVAKDQNKSLADVKAAMKTAITKQLDADVKAGRLTDAQRDRIVADLDQHLDRMVQGKPGRHDDGRRGDHDGPFHGPPPGGPVPPSGTAAPSSAPAGTQAS